VPAENRLSETATLLVSCQDRRGLVAALAQLLYGHGANILDADQHTDPVEGQFFQRIRFDISEIQPGRAALERAIAEVAERFQMSWTLHQDADLKKMAIFVSRYDHCLYDLLLRHRAGELRCQIALVISNHPDLKPIADQFGVEFHVFPITAQTKREQEDRACELLDERGIDLVVLARYMQILTSDFIARFPCRIINIHHSFRPAFIGSSPTNRPTSEE
jgi:formyltetrahydrofolate deformylase